MTRYRKKKCHNCGVKGQFRDSKQKICIKCEKLEKGMRLVEEEIEGRTKKRWVT